MCLGSPFRPDAINADADICSGADFIFDPGRDPWPYPDNTFSRIHASRVLETLPDDGERFFKELYRVSENRCNVHISVTHPRCDAFIHNHSFTTAWLPDAFTQLNKTHCAHLYFSDHNPPARALKWNVDFDVVRSEVALSNPGLTDHLTKVFSQPPLQVLSLTTNSISSFHVVLRARKR